MVEINLDYKYLVKSKANSYLSLLDVCANPTNVDDILNIICYHITDNSKYPFIQFMIHKVPYCEGFMNEGFVLPAVSLLNKSDTIETIVVNNIKQSLTTLGLNVNKLDTDAYNGIITDMFDEQYALIDISNVDISSIPQMYRNSPSWFVLPSEIINSGTICNINIDNRLVELFTYMPQLGILHDNKNETMFPLPYAAYTGSTIKKLSFQSVFGNPKRKAYDSCSPYYFFHKRFGKAVKEGGWSEKCDTTDIFLTHSNSGELLVDNEYGRYIKGGINRYAIFPTYDTTVHIEETDVATITDENITNYEDTIFISFKTGKTNNNPNVLVKEFGSFMPLSFHTLDKRILDIKYEIDKIDMYMIS
jgi:hypothetical protein